MPSLIEKWTGLSVKAKSFDDEHKIFASPYFFDRTMSRPGDYAILTDRWSARCWKIGYIALYRQIEQDIFETKICGFFRCALYTYYLTARSLWKILQCQYEKSYMVDLVLWQKLSKATVWMKSYSNIESIAWDCCIRTVSYRFLQFFAITIWSLWETKNFVMRFTYYCSFVRSFVFLTNNKF